MTSVNLSWCLHAPYLPLYLLFLKRKVKRRKQNANRIPQERSVHTTAVSTGESERPWSSAAICTHTCKYKLYNGFQVISDAARVCMCV